MSDSLGQLRLDQLATQDFLLKSKEKLLALPVLGKQPFL